MSRNKRSDSTTTPDSTDKVETVVKVEKVDHVANLLNAVEAFRSDGDVIALQAAYRVIPAASRAGAQGRALKAAGPDLFESVLDAFNDLPSVTASRTKVTLSDEETASIRLLARESLSGRLQWDDVAEMSELYREAFTALIDRLVAEVAKAPIGTARTHKATTMADLVTEGSIPAGTVLNGPNNATCVVNADASVTGTIEGVELTGSVSKVAGKFAGHSQNGWDFWRIDGQLIDTLRVV